MTDDDIEIFEIEEDNGQVRVDLARAIKRSSIEACPFRMMVPEHYRDDGTCKCNDPEERRRMVEEMDYAYEDFVAVGIEP